MNNSDLKRFLRYNNEARMWKINNERKYNNNIMHMETFGNNFS